MSLYNKIKWSLGILMVFLLILTTNLVDRSNFSKIHDAIVSIYEDRLVAGHLISEMTNIIHDQELRLVASTELKIDGSIKDLDLLMYRFDRTNLSAEEEIVFEEFKSTMETYKLLMGAGNTEKRDELLQINSRLKDQLYRLKKIQLLEGEVQMYKSQKAINSVELFTQIEIFVLVLLAVVIQIIVMYQPKTKRD